MSKPVSPMFPNQSEGSKGGVTTQNPCASVFIRGPLFASRKRQTVRVPQQSWVYPEEIRVLLI